jgi:hypothetical protein
MRFDRRDRARAARRRSHRSGQMPAAAGVAWHICIALLSVCCAAYSSANSIPEPTVSRLHGQWETTRSRTARAPDLFVKSGAGLWLRGTATILICCSERLNELAAKVGVGGFDGHDQVRNFGHQCPHRGLAHFRDQLLDSSKPGARVVRMDRADSAGMASVPGLQQRQHLADVNLADAGADRGNYARERSRYAPRSGAVS